MFQDVIDGLGFFTLFCVLRIGVPMIVILGLGWGLEKMRQHPGINPTKHESTMAHYKLIV